MASCERQQSGAAENSVAASGEHGEADGHNHAAHEDEVSLSSEAVERYGIRVAEAQLWSLRPTFIAPARVAFNTEAIAHVGSPLGGRAVEIKVRLGDFVKKDDPLLVVESPELGRAQTEFLVKRDRSAGGRAAGRARTGRVESGQGSPGAVSGHLADRGSKARGRVQGRGREPQVG
jgi:cobalt-zinc-cadmium efflux system membrane fusion protein